MNQNESKWNIESDSLTEYNNNGKQYIRPLTNCLEKFWCGLFAFLKQNITGGIKKNCKTNRYVLEKSIKVISVENNISERYISKTLDKAVKMFERMFGKTYLKL